MNAVLTEKKTKGQKRHTVTDIMGNLLAIVVHAANIHDTKAGIDLAQKAFEKYPTIESYRKSFEEDVFMKLGLGVDISKRIKPGFEILPKRWIVERTFAWLGDSRQLSKDYEIRTVSAVTMARISHLLTLLRRC